MIRRILILGILFIFLPGCFKKGIEYDPHQIVISSANREELKKLQLSLDKRFRDAKDEDKLLIELASAAVAVRLRDPDLAISRLTRRIGKTSPIEKFLVYAQLGEAYTAKGADDKADQAMEAAVKADVASPLSADLMLARASTQQLYAPSLAATTYTTAIAIGFDEDDKYEEAELKLAEALDKSKSPDAALWNLSVSLWYPDKTRPQKEENKKSATIIDVNTLLLKASGFYRAKEYNKAIMIYKTLLKEQTPYRRYLWMRIYNAAKLSTDLATQQEALTALTGEPAKPQKKADSEIELARFKWNYGQSEEAKIILRRVLRKEPNPRARFIIAKMYAEEREYSKALYYLDRVVKDTPNAPEAESALFWSAWYLFLNDRYAESKTEFAKYRDRYGFEAMFYQAAFFWEAVSAKKLGDTVTSDKIFRNLLDKDPYSFYGLLAQEELGKFPLPKPKPVPQMRFGQYLMKLSPKLNIEWLKLTEQLLSVGLDRYGLAFLESSLARIDERSNIPWRLRLYASQLYVQANKHLTGMGEINRMRYEEKELPGWSLWLLYPRPYWSIIKSAAKEFDVDPYMILAIIRQESAFNPKAVSSADAYGLTQLLQSTAAPFAKKAKINNLNRDSLFEPEINIRLGAAFIQDLKKRYKDKWVVILAAYNASPRIVDKWLKTRNRDETLEFIEEIPYQETRAYVKLVIRNYLTYRALYQPTGPYPEELISH